MTYKIVMVYKDDLTHVKCTFCNTEESFKTFDDTENFKMQTLANDWELGMTQSLTCITCNRKTRFYSWRAQDYFYQNSILNKKQFVLINRGNGTDSQY